MDQSQALVENSKSNLVVLAVTILALAMFILSAFQTFILTRARQNLEAARTNQEQPVQDAIKQRQRAEALAGRIATLAEEGNVNAKTIVETLRRQGVEMKPPKAAPAPDPAPAK